MAQVIQLRRGNAAAWTSADPVLAQGEFGFELDTGQFKIGDGTTAWTSLAYVSMGGGGGGTASSITFTPAGDVAATNVQTAIQELDTEKAASSHTHTAASITDFATAVDATGVLMPADIGTTIQGYSAVLAGTTASFTTVKDTKLTGIEALADVTDATNVAAAGAIMTGAIGSTVQAHSAILDATTASYTTALDTKLTGIEPLADVTDSVNVAAAGAVMGFPHLAAGDPIAIVAIGDSNMAGGQYNDLALAVANANVKCWMLPTLTSGSGCYVSHRNDIVWHSPNPNASARSAQSADAYGGAGGSQPLTTMTGQLLGGSCPIDLMLAYELQPLTGRDIYVYKNSQGSMQTDVWVNGSGAAWAGYTETFGGSNAGVTAALAAIPGSKTIVDIVVLSLGANDIAIGGITGQEWYEDRWSALYAQLLAASWFDPQITQVFLVECSNNGYAGLAAYYAGWDGFARMCANAPENLRLVSSMGAELGADDLHYPPTQYQNFAKTISKLAYIGPAYQTPIRTNTYVRSDSPTFSGDITLTDTITFTSQMTPTGGTDRVYIIDTDNAFASTDILWEWRNDSAYVAKVWGNGTLETAAGVNVGTNLVVTGQAIIGSTSTYSTGSFVSAVPDGGVAYSYSTAVPFTSGYLWQLHNNGVEKLSVAHSGNIASQGNAVIAGAIVGASLTTGGNISTSTGDITATAGDIIATAGDIISTAGNVTCSGGNFIGGAIVVTSTAIIGGTTTLQTGVIVSDVLQSGSATAFTLNTSHTMVGGDNIIKYQNNGTDLWKLGYAGTVTSPGQFISTQTTGSAKGFKFQTGSFSGSDKLAAFNNNGTDKLYVAHDGAVEAIGNGTVGTMILRPDSTNGSEQLELQSLGHSLLMNWKPNSNAASWQFTNYGTDAVGTDFVFVTNTAQSSGPIFQVKNSSTTLATVAWDGQFTCTGMSKAFRTSSGTSVTLTAADNMITLSSTSTVTCTLPSAVTYPGIEFIIKKTGASGTINITSVSSQTFDGAASPLAISVQNTVVILRSDGANWVVVRNGVL